eukprot:351017-Chlamydomonas_euryale.AAC.14
MQSSRKARTGGTADGSRTAVRRVVPAWCPITAAVATAQPRPRRSRRSPLVATAVCNTCRRIRRKRTAKSISLRFGEPFEARSCRWDASWRTAVS